MDVSTMFRLRDVINHAYEACDMIESMGLWKKTGKQSLKELFRFDLIKFGMYLTASDGEIKEEEALVFKTTLNANLSVDDLQGFISANNIYSTDFEKDIPRSIREAKKLEDNENSNEELVENLIGTFVEIFEMLGKLFIGCDDEVTDQEQLDLDKYLNMINSYIGVEDEGNVIDKTMAIKSIQEPSYEEEDNRILSDLDFETIKYSGFGSKVIQHIELPDMAMIVTARHTIGTSNFIVEYYDSEGDSTGVIVNEIGEYYGTTLFNNSRAEEGEGILDVKADGKWELTFVSIPNAIKPNGSSSISGHGDTISPMFFGQGGANVVNLTHRGDRNFIVSVYREDGRCQLLVNEIGIYNGEEVIKLEDGVRYFLEIEADGDWSIDFGYGEEKKVITQLEI